MPFSMIGNILGSSIGAAAGIYQQKQEQKFNAEQAQINRDYQTAEREATQQFNIDMWNMNNAYNSPQAQKQRLIDAGINPNAMFGTGASPGSSSAVTSNPQSGSLAQSNSGLSSALVNAGSSLGVNTANMMKTLSEKNLNDYELAWNKRTEQQRLDYMDGIVKKDLAQIQRWMVENGVDKATEQQILELNKYIAPMKEKELKLMEARLNDLAVDFRQKEAQIRLTDQQTETEKNRTELVGFQADQTDEAAYNTYLQNLQLEMQNEFSKTTGIPFNADCFQVAYGLWMKGAGAFSNFINNFLVPQERISWKVQDYIGKQDYETTESSNDQHGISLFSLDFGLNSTSQETKKGTYIYNPHFNGSDGFFNISNGGYADFRNPSMSRFDVDTDYRGSYRKRRRRR